MAQRQFRSDDTDKWIYGFGDGADESTYSVPANEGCSGTSGETSLTLASAGSFSDGDLVLIHQSRGTGAGNWELNKIASGAGGTSLTMTHNLMNTYADSGNSQAQIIELKQYENLTIGNTTAPSWDGSKGGILAFLDKGTTTISGTLTLTGGNGATRVGTGVGSQATGRGFRGGQAVSGNDLTGAYQAEGSSGTGGVSTAANGNGGGGGSANGLPGNGDGGGGGNGATGGTGGNDGGTSGTGGASVGSASLVTMFHGGGGGGGFKDNNGTAGGGGAGGGICVVIASEIVITGAITLNGGSGADGNDNSDGGGGAGGSCLLKAQTATLGTTKITSSGGGGTGGGGAVGRIHIDYKNSYTGTTTPTIDATQDSSLDYITTNVGDIQGFFLA